MAKTMQEKGQILVFDLGGVLINLDVERCMARFRELMGAENMQAVLGLGSDGEGVRSVSIAGKQLMADFERGNITPDTFVTEVLRFCRPGTTPQAIQDAWWSMVADLPQERLDYLRELKRQGYRMYLLSNGNDLHFNAINALYRLDTYFEQLFLSQKMHLAKPEKAIFEQVNQTVNPGNGQVFFIDDLAPNRIAAQKFVNWRTFASLEELKQSINLL